MQDEKNAYQKYAQMINEGKMPAPGSITGRMEDGTAIRQAKDIRTCPPHTLETITARDLQVTELPPLAFIVEGILPQGLSILAAPSKYGKSWLSFDLCLSVAAGKPFLGYETTGGETLYLALEDGLRRLKGRMDSILKGVQAPAGVHLATSANAIGSGLTEQINEHLARHPDTKLIVIDVLERVRTAGSRSTSAYTVDYQNMGALKSIADEHNLCVLVIHHTRKMKDDSDVYNSISGTNGIMGACDTIWVMQRDNREDDQTKLFMTGRDIEQQSIVVTLDKAAHRWRKIGTVEEQAAEKARGDYEADPTVKTVKALLALR